MNSASLDTALAGTGYVALRELGKGGYGVVYEARHTSGVVRAVKVLQRRALEDPSAAERLRLEVETLQAIDHDGVVRVFGSGQTSHGDLFYAMELLDGLTLGRFQRSQGPCSFPTACVYVIQILQGLAAAHRLGIVHRDMKPENVFLTPGGYTKILDFGIAKVFQPSAQGPAPLAVPTADGMMIGSLRWCAPEAIASIPLDHRADLYSVGLILHSLLTGKVAWHERRDQTSLVRAQLTEMPSSVADVLPNAEAQAADALIARLCAKRPDERFGSASEASDAVLDAVRPFAPSKAAPRAEPLRSVPHDNVALGPAAKNQSVHETHGPAARAAAIAPALPPVSPSALGGAPSVVRRAALFAFGFLTALAAAGLLLLIARAVR